MTLTLDLIRHGEAVSAARGGDSQRSLTTGGRLAVKALALALAAQSWRPARLFASPYRRAQETATLLARHATRGVAVETLDALIPDGDPGEVVRELRVVDATQGHVVLVGHMPLLGRVCGALADDPRAFAPAELCRLEFPAEPVPGAGAITFTLHPKR